MQALADNHAREFSRLTRELHTIYGQIGGYLTFEARQDTPGGAPKRAERARDEIQRSVKDLAAKLGRFADAEIASLRNYQMISTDKAKEQLARGAKASVEYVNRFARLLSELRLGADPAANVRQIGELDTHARRIVSDFERSEADLLSHLRRS